MVIDTRSTTETVRLVEADIGPTEAVMVVVPSTTLDASPVLSIVATDASVELHRAVAVMSCVEVSLKVPVAVNCLVAPSGIELFSGAMVSETSVAPVTVTDAVPDTVPEVTVMVELPAATACPRPLASTVTLAELDDHVADVST